MFIWRLGGGERHCGHSPGPLVTAEVSDGIIAPGYEPEALFILSKKKQGEYVILQMDPDYEPPSVQTRDVFGVTLEEQRNEERLNESALENVVTRNAEFTGAARLDALVALITLKYTQSNSVCIAADGQTIGIGAGQQSRIHCTRIACAKADLWRLRQHPDTIGLPFRSGLRRPEKDNGVDLYLRDDLTRTELVRWKGLFEKRRRASRRSKNISGWGTLGSPCWVPTDTFRFGIQLIGQFRAEWAG